jgi:hypothetical protein
MTLNLRTFGGTGASLGKSRRFAGSLSALDIRPGRRCPYHLPAGAPIKQPGKPAMTTDEYVSVMLGMFTFLVWAVLAFMHLSG